MERPVCKICNIHLCEISKRVPLLYRKKCWNCRIRKDVKQFSQYKKARKNSRIKLKESVINYYGGKCSCCGEKILEFLTIDHINNDGNKHRKANSTGGGYNMYFWIKKNSYPSDLRVLCFNCNCGRQVNGGTCPHKQFPLRDLIAN